MQKNVVWLGLVLGTLVCSVAVGISYSQEIPEMGMMVKSLKLSEDQVTKMETMRLDQEKKSIRLKADLRVARLELDELLKQEDVNEKAVTDKVTEISKLESGMMLSRVNNFITVKKLLTPEQRTQLSKMKVKRMMGMQEKRGMKERKMAPREDDDYDMGKDKKLEEMPKKP